MSDTGSKYRDGPKLTVVYSCQGCAYEQSEYYAVQSDTGYHVYCCHTLAADNGKRRRVGYSWNTPEWCPLRHEHDADLRTRLTAAESEVARLREALERIGATEPERDGNGEMHQRCRECGWSVEVCDVPDADNYCAGREARAALKGASNG